MRRVSIHRDFDTGCVPWPNHATTPRFEAANTRIQTMQAFTASITLAIPVTARSLNPEIGFQDWRFLLAVVLAATVTAVGVFGRLIGSEPAET